jgi:hypothetical protein
MIPLTCTGGKERGFGKLAKISVRKTLGKVICDKNNFWNAEFVYIFNAKTVTRLVEFTLVTKNL